MEKKKLQKEMKQEKEKIFFVKSKKKVFTLVWCCIIKLDTSTSRIYKKSYGREIGFSKAAKGAGS